MAFANALSDLAAVRHKAGQNSEAKDLLGESLAIWDRTCPQGHATVPIVLNSMARVQKAMGDSQAAEASIQRALTEAERIYGTNHPEVAPLLVTHSTLLRTTSRIVEAEKQLRLGLRLKGSPRIR